VWVLYQNRKFPSLARGTGVVIIIFPSRSSFLALSAGSHGSPIMPAPSVARTVDARC